MQGTWYLLFLLSQCCFIKLFNGENHRFAVSLMGFLWFGGSTLILSIMKRPILRSGGVGVSLKEYSLL